MARSSSQPSSQPGSQAAGAKLLGGKSEKRQSHKQSALLSRLLSARGQSADAAAGLEGEAQTEAEDIPEEIIVLSQSLSQPRQAKWSVLK